MIYEKHAVFNLDIEIKTISYPKAYLENILYNLISNALKYSRSEIPPEITISTTMHEGKVQISVKDNGLGIDLEKYGDRVFKLNQVFHEGFDSKGVGLYLTKTQVESLGGKIELKSVLNEGSEFIVTI
jgi:signal transduction histidine kinase